MPFYVFCEVIIPKEVGSQYWLAHVGYPKVLRVGCATTEVKAECSLAIQGNVASVRAHYWR